MLRIGICDDESDVRDSLRFQLEKILDEKTEQIVYEFSDGLVASNWVKKHPGEIDLLFLDIEMEKQNGMETAKIIREYDKDIAFAFVTGYTEYVYEGYEVEAIGYFIKPISLKQLNTLIERMRKKLQEKDMDDYYCFKNADGTYRISKKDILFLESDKRQIHIKTLTQDFVIYGKLNDIEQDFAKDSFVRIHNRYLVNSKHVAHIGTDSLLINSEKLPFSRSHKKEAIQALAKQLIKE